MYTILCKLGGHSVSGFKVTWGGGLLKAPPPVPQGGKKPGLNRVKMAHIRFFSPRIPTKIRNNLKTNPSLPNSPLPEWCFFYQVTTSKTFFFAIASLFTLYVLSKKMSLSPEILRIFFFFLT